MGLATYLIAHNYSYQLKQAEKSTLSTLYSIASTLAQQVDRNALQDVFLRFPLQGDTSGLHADPVWQMYCELFKEAAEINELKTPIYTLTFDSVSNAFIGGVASNGQQTYGWHYTSPPDELRSIYTKGGVIHPFEDEHGTWLSAVYPLLDPEGNPFAVVEVDYPFDSFILEARDEAIRNALVSTLVLLLVGVVTFPMLRQVLQAEERSKAALSEAKDRLQEANNEVKSSLEYARTIQVTMLPENHEMVSFFHHCFVFNRPRDIVSGDFYWFRQLDDERALIAVADCTGHGVPGALMSIMGHNFLNEIVIEQETISPCEILERLDHKIHGTFSDGSGVSSKGTDGMDVGVCLVNRTERTVTFSGARRLLTIVSDLGTQDHHGVKRGIGEHYLAETVHFKNERINLPPNAVCYLYTDGMPDQFGGDDSKKLLRKRMVRWLNELQQTPDELKLDVLMARFAEWKGENPQVDDVCLIGFQV